MTMSTSTPDLHINMGADDQDVFFENSDGGDNVDNKDGKNPCRLRPSLLVVGLSHNSQPTTRPTVGLSHNSPELCQVELHEMRKAVAADVAVSISETMKTVGLLAALLSSWAVGVYSGEVPLDEGLCFGRVMIQATYVMHWICLAFFFLCVSSTLAIMADLNGVPRKYLFHHLQHKYVRIIYLIPELSMIFGVIFLAVGFVFDLVKEQVASFSTLDVLLFLDLLDQ